MKPVSWKKTTAFEGPEQSPGFLLWQVSSLWRRQIEAALSPLGLTHPQFVILASLGWLTRGGKTVSQAELARYAKTDIAMTSQILRGLEKKGFLERKPNPSDERAKRLQLTAKGVDLVEKAVPAVEEADRSFFQVLGSASSDLVALFQILSAFQKPRML